MATIYIFLTGDVHREVIRLYNRRRSMYVPRRRTTQQTNPSIQRSPRPLPAVVSKEKANTLNTTNSYENGNVKQKNDNNNGPINSQNIKKETKYDEFDLDALGVHSDDVIEEVETCLLDTSCVVEVGVEPTQSKTSMNR